MHKDTKALKRAYRKTDRAVSFKRWCAEIGEAWTSKHPLKAQAHGWCCYKSASLWHAVT